MLKGVVDRWFERMHASNREFLCKWAWDGWVDKCGLPRSIVQGHECVEVSSGDHVPVKPDEAYGEAFNGWTDWVAGGFPTGCDMPRMRAPKDNVVDAVGGT